MNVLCMYECTMYVCIYSMCLLTYLHGIRGSSVSRRELHGPPEPDERGQQDIRGPVRQISMGEGDQHQQAEHHQHLTQVQYECMYVWMDVCTMKPVIHTYIQFDAMACMYCVYYAYMSACI